MTFSYIYTLLAILAVLAGVFSFMVLREKTYVLPESLRHTIRVSFLLHKYPAPLRLENVSSLATKDKLSVKTLVPIKDPETLQQDVALLEKWQAKVIGFLADGLTLGEARDKYYDQEGKAIVELLDRLQNCLVEE